MAPQFVVYWLGYSPSPPAIQSLPQGIDVVNLFVLNLTSGSGGTTLDTDFITSHGTTWTDILSQAQAARAKGVKVCVSIIPPRDGLTWNTIPDPQTFAQNVYNLVTEWNLDGIDIDPEQGGMVPPDQNFITVLQALSQHFGPQSATGLRMSYVTFNYAFDQSLLQATAQLFDVVMLMGYTWTFSQMTTEFGMYSSVVSSQNLMFGIGGSPWSTSYDETIDLAQWQPAAPAPPKAGMMEFNINDDANYQFALGILEVLKPGGA